MASRSSLIRCGALTCLAFVLGCGGGDGAKPMKNLVPVKGTVTYDGKPLDHGMVSFAPAEGSAGQPATGKIENGSFTMITTVSAPGVVAGKYRVRIESTDAAGTPAPPPLNPGDKYTPPKSLISEKYTDFKSSGLKVDVKPGMEPLKWDLKP